MKYDAIREYHSQWSTLRGLMERFARGNELFAQPQSAVLPDLQAGDADRPDTWQDAAGAAIAPVERDPQRDFITRSVTFDDDLIAVYAARSRDGDLLLCSQMRGPVNPLLMYSLQVNAVSDSGVVHHGAQNLQRPAGWRDPKLTGAYVCDQVSLAALGDPWVVFVGAKVQGAGPEFLDQIAWQAVYIDQAPPVQ